MDDKESTVRMHGRLRATCVPLNCTHKNPESISITKNNGIKVSMPVSTGSHNVHGDFSSTCIASGNSM